MGSRYEVEVTLSSAKDLKNINWKNGPTRPYVVAWVDPDRKVTSRIDEEGDTSPKWNQTLTVPLYGPVEDATLYFDVVHHASPDEDIKPLIGSAKLDLRDVVEEAGIGTLHACSLKVKRPSGRPHGKLKLEITIREPQYHPYPPPHHVGYDGESRDVHPYGQPPMAYGGQPAPYGDPGYGQPAYGYGHGHGHGYEEEEKKKSGFGGMGTGLAIGAAAGIVGGVAAYAAYDAITDDAEEEAAEEVENDAGDEDDD